MLYFYLILCCLCGNSVFAGDDSPSETLTAVEAFLSAQPTPVPETSPPHPVLAPEEKPSEEVEFPKLQTTTTSYESAFLKMIFVLIAILVVVFALFFILKRLSSKRLHQSNQLRTIKILEKRAISPKSLLYLIEIGGQKILIAESQLEVRLISSLDWIENDRQSL